jgi:hypothetical protein
LSEWTRETNERAARTAVIFFIFFPILTLLCTMHRLPDLNVKSKPPVLGSCPKIR